MRYYPLNYDKLNLFAGTYTPSTYKARNNRSFAFWERALFQRACSSLVFDFPEVWKGDTKDFILFCLFKNGFVGVANDKKFGLFAQPGTLSGYGFYYGPVTFKLANPMLSKDYTIGKDCEILKLTPDYMGVWDIIDRYAELLSSMDNAINSNINNAKYPHILGAKNKSAAAGIKKILDLVGRGEPSIVYDQRISDALDGNNENPFQYLDLKTKDHYMVTQELQDLATILNQFDTEIGIPTIPYEKKERLVTSEAESKTIESVARITVWAETFNSSAELVNKMFNTTISCRLRYNNTEEAKDDGEDYNSGDGKMAES